MIGLGAGAIEFKNRKILSLLQVLNRSCFNIIAAVKKLVVVMTELIKYLMQVFIYLVMQVGKLCTAVMIARIRQIKYLVLRNHPVKTMSYCLPP